MKKILFFMKRFKFSSIKTLFYIAKKVKKRSKKHFVVFDMIHCLIKYQAAFYDYLEFEFYDLTKEQRSTYLTNGKNNEIVKKFNDRSYFHLLDNKDEFNDYFKEFLKRDYLKPNSSEKEFKKFIKGKDKVIVKPVDGVGGKGIEILSTDTPNLYDNYKNYLMEELIEQHPKMAKLYDKSVNSIRVFTFFDGKDAYLLQAILKVGNNGVVDNFSSGGMYTFLDENGKVIAPAIDQADNIFEVHPISGEKILGFEVPKYKELVSFIKEAAKKMPYIKYIGWDVAITKDGPVIIEGNCFPGVFQVKPRFDKTKTGLLPKYKKIMKI